jgi:hypothetical protein
LLCEPGDAEVLREEFQATGCAMMPGFVSPEILGPVLRKLATSELTLREEATEQYHFGRVYFAGETDPARIATVFLLNNPKLFRLVEAITGCGRIENFLGRVHKTIPNAGQELDWHNDLIDGRVMGFTINLSTGDYAGGDFHLRSPNGKVTTVGKISAGDAYLFRVSPGWDHCLTALERGSRTVAVGWFRTEPVRSVFVGDWLNYTPSATASLQPFLSEVAE